jgi:hypothetical protein
MVKNTKRLSTRGRGQRAALALLLGLSGFASGAWELAHGQEGYLFGLLGGTAMLALAWFNLRRLPV